VRAMVVMDPGDRGWLEPRELPDPVPQSGEVVVAVAATSVNNADRVLLSGQIAQRLGTSARAADVPGIDAAGTIVEVGSKELQHRVGERVAVNGVVTCDACLECLSGNHGMCPERRALGQLLNGGYAELVCVPTSNAVPIADRVPFEEAAALMTVGMTAWQALVRRAGLSQNESVLVSGAAGGVGGAGVQIARHMGARVVAVASSAERLNHALALGAHAAVASSSPTFAEEVRDLTSGGPNVILDVAGWQTWPMWFDVAARSARVVTCVAGSEARIAFGSFVAKQLALFATGPSGSKADALRIIQLLDAGALRGDVGAVLPLDRAPEAIHQLSDRAAPGKLILKP
jgi:NADPH:quinone reductase-like Zn-dependent oxidoreductase